MSSTTIQTLSFHVADHGHLGHFARFFAPFVDDRKRRADPLCQLAGAGHAAHVGRDDHDVGKVFPEGVLDIQGKDGRGVQVIHGDVEEALNLGGVQIHCQDTRSIPDETIMFATSLAEIGVRALVRRS